MITIGLIGKTNVGKTTFFNAATLLEKEVSNYPFTTKEPNIGTAYAKTICVCKEFNVKCQPNNSVCIEGYRFIPVRIIDVPGLIKGAWRGKGLGNKFLSVAARSDALIHIVDASGGIDAEGNIVKPGVGDPIKDFFDVENEIVNWFESILRKNMKDISKFFKRVGRMDAPIYKILSGLKISLNDISEALNKLGLYEKDIALWSDEEYRNFAKIIRRMKPTLIVANKMDVRGSEKNYDRLMDKLNDYIIVPCSAEAELALRRAVFSGLIEYIPGEEKFFIKDESKLNEKQKWAIKYLEERVMDKWIRTGIQDSIDIAVFKLLGMNTVYPVADEKTLTDNKGKVLPDVYLLPPNSTLKDLAMLVHSELADSLLYGIDARSGIRLPKNYRLRDRDVIKLVTTSKKR
ncbi:MAG: redox-regulated ATPase YchF [Thermoproteales archaeon]|nr:redox-regulated ATPase YchF [Thermoproteales archaeon]